MGIATDKAIVRVLGFCCLAPVSAILAAAQTGTPAAVPDPLALIKEVEAHQRQLDAIRENFTFREVQDTRILDSKGAVTTHWLEEREVFFVNRRRIARLVKRDGRNLSPKESKAEDDRVRHLVEKAQKEPLTGDSFLEGGVIEMSRVLAVMSLSNPRRTTMSGRSTLAFDFTGDRHASAHGLTMNAAKKIAGTVWIDENDRQVARLEANFFENFRVGGGLLAIVQKGTWMRLEQTYAGQGLWLPESSELHLAARELVVKGVRQNVKFNYSDFRRFDTSVSTSVSQTPGAPN